MAAAPPTAFGTSAALTHESVTNASTPERIMADFNIERDASTSIL
jgi:hypothetical protein